LDVNFCPFEAQNIAAPKAHWPTRRERNGVFALRNSPLWPGNEYDECRMGDVMRFASVLCSALLAATPLLAQTRDIGAPPGRLADIGARNLHVYCTGSGSPSVILEAGAGAFAIDWSLG
jgi:hypothetical protein